MPKRGRDLNLYADFFDSQTADQWYCRLRARNGRLVVPDDPIIPFIEGDGTGPDIWRASVSASSTRRSTKAFGGKRKIAWFEVPAGEKAKEQYGEWLPDDTLEAFE